MNKRIKRRLFIKKSIALGAGTLLSGMFASALHARKYPHGADIGVVTGSNYFDATMKSVELIGGIGAFVKSGASVGILINSPLEKPGTYTNPDVALAVAKMCFDAGASEVISLDSANPAYWQRSALAGEHAGIISKIGSSSGKLTVPIPNGISLKEAEMSIEVFDADVFINIPVAKHHKGTNYTGTLKNMMRLCAPSTNKFIHKGSGDEGPYDDIEFLSQCIADLNTVRKPDLCVVDMTSFVITNGPAGPGDLKKLDTVVAGKDCVAVDAFCANKAGFTDVKMFEMATKLGVGNMDYGSLVVKEINL